MKFSLSQLYRLAGTIDRGAYALIGLIGFAIKHNLDRLVATYGFYRPWGIFNYWMPVIDVGRITDLRSPEAGFLATMVALSLPFIWVGVVLTLKRLRSAQLPAALVGLFFVPFVNLLFFVVLCLIPERQPRQDYTEPPRFARVVPVSSLGSAAVSLLITVPVGFATAVLGTQVLRNYGWGLFIALPFTMGFAAAVIYGVSQQRSLRGCIGVACLAVAILAAGLLGLAVEGIVCLLMAAPLAFPLAIFGGICGYYVQKRRWLQDAPVILSALLLFSPGLEYAERLASTQPPVFVVRTAIDVSAPPEKVWREVVAFSQIPPPKEWMFRAGIAYPIRAEIVGYGPGSERHCVFSTGAFVEPIQIWDAPHLLKFSVTSNPAPMQEWTPYFHIDPPHLHGFLVSQGGQFLLTPLPNGGTRLEGTTWYRHGLWPSAYWRVWSDAISHRIHFRVLQHIRDVAETTR